MTSLTAHLVNEVIDTLRSNITLPESEETWDSIANSVGVLGDLCNDGACDFPEEVVPAIKSLSGPLISALHSERTRLSGSVIALIETLATSLGSEFKPLLSLYFPPLLLLCTRTNKVVFTRARMCIVTIIQSTQSPSILSHLLQHAKDKSSSLRLVVAEGVLACVKSFNPPDLERDLHAQEVEALVRITVTDPNAEVRKVGRMIFDAYKLALPTRLESFVTPLSPRIKKYLEIPSRIFTVQPNTTVTVTTVHPTDMGVSQPIRQGRITSSHGPKIHSSFHSRIHYSSTMCNQSTNRSLANQIKKIEPRRVIMPGVTRGTACSSKSTSVRPMFAAPPRNTVASRNKIPPGSRVTSGPTSRSSSAKRMSQLDLDAGHSDRRNEGRYRCVTGSKLLESPHASSSAKIIQSKIDVNKSKKFGHYPPATSRPITTSSCTNSGVAEKSQSRLKPAKAPAVSKSFAAASHQQPCTTIPVPAEVVNQLNTCPVSSVPVTNENSHLSKTYSAASCKGNEDFEDLHPEPATITTPPRSRTGTPSSDCNTVSKTPISALLAAIEEGFLATP